MNTKKLFSAAMAAIMLTSGSVIPTYAESFSALSESTIETSSTKPYYDKDGRDLPGTYVTEDGFVYAIDRYSPGGKVCRLMDYVGDETDLVIPKEIDGYKVKYIGDYYDNPAGFECNDKIKSVTILADIKTIHYCSFSGCQNLEKVVLPDSITEIEDSVFAFCPKLESVNIPKHLNKMGSRFAWNSKWLANKEKKEKLVVIKGTLISGRLAAGKVKLPANVKEIGGYAFEGNKKMTELTVPGTCESIGKASIIDCSKLTKITFMNGVKYSSYHGSLGNCPALKKVILPPSMTTEGVEGVYGEKNVTYYYYRGTPAEKALKYYNKTSKFPLKIAVLPGKTTKFKATAQRKRVKLEWKAVSTASGYQLQIAQDSKFKKACRTVTLAGGSRTSRTLTGVKSGRKYYIRQRSYRVVGGKRYYGNYTKARTVRVK